MNKRILFFAFTILSTLTNSAFADDFFGAGGSPATKSSTIKNNRAMSADDFKSAVAAKAQQAKTDLSTQWKQDIANTPPPPKNNQAAASPSLDTNSATANQFTADDNAANSNNMSRSAPPPATKTTTAAPPTPSYSGFGTNAPSTPASSTPSSTTKTNANGWKVHY